MIDQIDHLIFEGGGSVGVVYIGALDYIEKANDGGGFKNLKSVIGTSAGSVVAMMLALNFDVCEMKHYMSLMSNDVIKGCGIFEIFSDMYRLHSDFGLHSGQGFLNLLRDMVEFKFGYKNATLGNLRDDDRFSIDLTVVVTNLTRMCVEYVNADTHPNMEIAMAVRASSSIPDFFTPVKMLDEDGNEDLFVDGGTCDNYPFSFQKHKHKHTLGFKIIDPDTEIVGGVRLFGGRREIKSIVELNIALLETILLNNDQRNLDLNRDYWNRTICIPVKDHSIMDFDFNDEEREKMLNLGLEAAKKYFEKRKTLNLTIDQ